MDRKFIYFFLSYFILEINCVTIEKNALKRLKIFWQAKKFLGTRFPGSPTICTSDTHQGPFMLMIYITILLHCIDPTFYLINSYLLLSCTAYCWDPRFTPATSLGIYRRGRIRIQPLLTIHKPKERIPAPYKL